MNDYEEIINSLVKLRNYCCKRIRERSNCCGCEFDYFCGVNLEDPHPFPNNWVFEDETIICED